MTTQISGDTGVSQCQPNSVSQDDLQSGVVGNGAMWRGTRASFSNTANPSQQVSLTETHAESVVQSGVNVTPGVAGWYLCSLTGQCTGATVALGLGISIPGATAFQAQPPYNTNLAYVTVTTIAYFNGTTDSASFSVFGTVNGCAFNDLIGTLILVRAA